MQLDVLRGYHDWRNKESSSLYDSFMLNKRMRSIKKMIDNKDIFNLMFRLRGGIARDQFGMQHEGLFSRALAGTKKLVEEYLETECRGLDYICDVNSTEEEVSSGIILNRYYHLLIIIYLMFYNRFQLMQS